MFSIFIKSSLVLRVLATLARATATLVDQPWAQVYNDGQDEMTHGAGKRPPCRQLGGVYFKRSTAAARVTVSAIPSDPLPYSP